jgi:hypothetical protein
MQVPDEMEEFLAGQDLVEVRPFGHIADDPPDGVRLSHDVKPGDPRPARGRLQERGQHLQRGGLAGAVGAEQAQNLSGRDRQRQIVYGFLLAVAPAEPVERIAGVASAIRTGRRINDLLDRKSPAVKEFLSEEGAG